MFWEAAASSTYPAGYTSNTLPVRSDTLGFGTHATEKQYRLPGRDGSGTPARVTARLRIRPIGMDVLHDLVDSGDLAPAMLEQMPTFSFGAQLEWTDADGFGTPLMATPKTDCMKYRCLLEPESERCK